MVKIQVVEDERYPDRYLVTDPKHFVRWNSTYEVDAATLARLLAAEKEYEWMQTYLRDLEPI